MNLTKSIPTMNQLLFRCVTLVGYAAVLFSSQRPWFSVPTAVDGNMNRVIEFVANEPRCTHAFQFMMVVGISVLTLSSLKSREWNLVSNLTTCSMLATVLAYPYFVMTYSPSLTADAIWLQMQHDNLIWLGGDINLSAEVGNAFWGNKIYSVDIPRQIKIAPIPTNHLRELGIHHLSDVLNWFGYSDAFCQFSKRGWSMAACGWSMLIAGTLVAKSEVQFSRVGYSIVTLILALASFGAYVVSVPFIVAGHIENAATLTRQRDYAAAIQSLELACQRMPALEHDTHWIAQRGSLECKLGRINSHAQLFRAIELERGGKYDAAYEQLLSLIDSGDTAIAREAIRAVQRFAIQDFNSGNALSAAERLNIVLVKQPCNLKAIYLSQLCFLRQGRSLQVEAMSKWLDKAARHLSFNSKKILSATVHKYDAISSSQKNDAAAAWHSIRQAKNP